ncbi:MAG: hypothetical protein GX094_00765 [Clostridiales bacterium]|jgi:UDP-N-acetylmuramyl pentapeptide phosphotransferase/UDP-N-acetylglucosamine-1-phosphate transferase|nr:hypothetical protein [Clostridiales bacterium]
MSIAEHILAFGIACMAARYFVPRIYEILKADGRHISNYRGRPVVTGMGLALMFPCLFGMLPFLLEGVKADCLSYLAAVVSLVVLGIVDDMLGDGKVRGIMGHMKVILKGGLSTGGIKLIIAVFLGAVLSCYYYSHVFHRLLYALVFLLFINFINLMDLRPGRAIKVFLFLLVVLALLGRFSNIRIFLPVIAAVPFYIKGEMNERYMLGDTGANLLGGMLGYYTIRVLSPVPAFAIASVLLLIQLAAEHYSISKFIETTPFLRHIDEMWRMKKDADTGMDRV